jgi:hypothetical protein
MRRAIQLLQVIHGDMFGGMAGLIGGLATIGNFQLRCTGYLFLVRPVVLIFIFNVQIRRSPNELQIK